MPPLQAVVPFLLDNPEAVVVLAVVMRAVLAWQRSLSWPEYRTLHGLKRLAFPAIQPVVPFGSLVNAKGGRDDAEFIATVDRSLRTTVRSLTTAGGTLHLLNSVKRRPATHGDPLSIAHVRFRHGDEQTEAYLFRNDDGTVDVYAHFEAGPETPLEHLTEAQTDGDPRGVVTEALAEV